MKVTEKWRYLFWSSGWEHQSSWMSARIIYSICARKINKTALANAIWLLKSKSRNRKITHMITQCNWHTVITSTPSQLNIPTTLTGTGFAHARPRARRPSANTNGTCCCWHVSIIPLSASFSPSAAATDSLSYYLTVIYAMLIKHKYSYSWAKALFMSQGSLHEPRLSSWAKALFMNQGSLHEPRLSSWAKALFMNQGSLHEPRLSSWTKALFMSQGSQSRVGS